VSDVDIIVPVLFGVGTIGVGVVAVLTLGRKASGARTVRSEGALQLARPIRADEGS
jgi:hypothetical protein